MYALKPSTLHHIAKIGRYQGKTKLTDKEAIHLMQVAEAIWTQVGMDMHMLEDEIEDSEETDDERVELIDGSL